uniref:Uncharacterized protein n=1 Tax=Sphaerodactylus townsendi TaxID=933632 RepID=A0ACB8F2Z3_9SAUR
MPVQGIAPKEVRTNLLKRKDCYGVEASFSRQPCSRLAKKARYAAIMPGLLLGDEAPNFEAETTHGRIRFHEFLGNS